MTKSMQFVQNEKGDFVFIDADGTIHENVRPIKLFPLTDVDHWVSIVSHEGHEILCIENPEESLKNSYALLKNVLARHHFVPVIKIIHSIKRLPNGHEWNVTTDRGIISFVVETDESIQTLGYGRYVIFDKRNTRYLIPDVANLDRHSRHKLEHYY